LIPLLLNVLNGSRLFTRPWFFPILYRPCAVLAGGLCGGALGLLFSPRLLPGRKAAVLLSALVGLLVIVKGALIRTLAALRFVLWVLPPVYNASVAYSTKTYFNFSHAWGALLWLPPIPLRRSRHIYSLCAPNASSDKKCRD